MIKFMTSVLFVLFVCTAAEAQQNARSGKWDRVTDPYNHEYVDAATAAIREVMEENFRACTTEDLKAVMTTMTSNCPDRENFMVECQKMFDDTDVYIRLVDCRWITSWRDTKGLWAAVQITQWTMAKDDDVDYTEYRHRSGLLPKWELCEYQLYARVEKGQWKAHVINGGMSEAFWPAGRAPAKRQEVRQEARAAKPAPEAQASNAKGDCPDGTCPNQWPATPHVRPRMTPMKK